MAKSPARQPEPDPIAVVKEILVGAETLVEQQVGMLRAEVGRELRRASEAALSAGVGAALLGTGGLFCALAAVHGLRRATRLPLGTCYALAGGLLGATGIGFLALGRERAAGVRLLPPPETADAFRENYQWLREQLHLTARERPPRK